MQANLQVSRPFWSNSFSLEFELQVRLRKYFICDIAQICLEKIVPANLFQEDQVLNIKGRDNALLGAAGSSVSREEIVFVASRLLTQNRVECGHFQAQLQSEFLAYPDKLNISHKLSQHHRGEYPEGLKLQDLARVFPAELESFRLGLEFFSSRFAVSMLGRTPLVTRRLMVDCKDQDLRLCIMAEKLKQIDTLPCSELPGFSELSSRVNRATSEGIEIEKIFAEKLRSVRL